MLGPYEVLDTLSHTVTILRDGLPDKISKDRVVRAPIPAGPRLGRPTRPVAPIASPIVEGNHNDAMWFPDNQGPQRDANPATFEEVVTQLPNGRLGCQQPPHQTSSRMTPRLMLKAQLTGAPMSQVKEQSLHRIPLPPTTRWLTTPTGQKRTTNTGARVRVHRCSEP